MATILSFLSGRQITNNNGVPQAGALLYHYQEGTTSNLTVYSNDAGTTPHAQPVVCDAGGFVPLIYISDTSDWKVVIQTALGVTLQTYDNLTKAPTETSTSSFAAPQFPFTQVTSASSPVTLLASDAGKAYEANTTSGSITFNLPSAASVGNGKGFVFKKTATANSLILDPSGSETIDDVSTSLTITLKDTVTGIFSNGAEWYKITEVIIPVPTVQRFTSGTAATYTPATNVRFIRVKMRGGGGGGAAGTTNNGANGTTSSFGSWTAILGNGGSTSSGVGGAGGTGGATGTGILINREDGQDGGGDWSFATSGSGTTVGAAGGGIGGGGTTQVGAGIAAKANTGSGGGGSGGGASGGGAGELVEFFVLAPTATTYTVGTGGAGGSAGGTAGGNGSAGIIIVEEYY
jgi:hypothetical protein